VAFGPDGNLYVASELTHEVKRYDGATGAFIDNFVTAGSGGVTQRTFLTFAPQAIPEPGTLTLLVIGLAGGAVAVYRRRKAS